MVSSVTARLQSACASHSGGEHQGFFYVDGIPSKGLWVDLMEVRSWDDIRERLELEFPLSDLDELLCADIEGLPKHFYYSACDSFSMNEWVDFLEDWESHDHLEAEIIDAYFDNCGVVGLDQVEEAYSGQFNSDEDFAYDLMESTGDLSQIPESLRFYFDYEKFARDLMMGDYFSSNGYYFRNC
jgi:antirestriction protein